MTTETNKPVDKIRDGALVATIWKNPGKGDKPPFYSVEISRSYQDEEGAYHDSHSFSGSELLRAARLMNIAYSEILIHRAKDRAAAEASGSAA